MNTAAFSNLLDGTVQLATGTSLINLPLGLPPVQFYRQVLFLHFPTGGMAEGIRVAKDVTNLNVQFSELEYDALEPVKSELIAILESIDTETVGVQLDASREIKKAILSPNSVTESGYTLAFYDFDGIQVSGEPAEVADVANGVAELENAYAASHFALRLKNTAGLGVPLGPNDLLKLVGEQAGSAGLGTLDTQTRTIDLKAPRRIYRIRFTSGSNIPSGSRLEFYRLELDTPSEKPTAVAVVSDHIATLADEFIAARFAVRLKQNDDTYRHRNYWIIEKLTVRTYPTGPRLGITSPNDLMADRPGEPAKPIYFWQQPGEFRDNVALPGNADGARMLVEELQRYLDGCFEDLKRQNRIDGSAGYPPQHITAALVVESDAPCRFDLTQLEVPYQLISANTFTSGRDKHVLRFSGAAVETKQITLALPTHSTVASAGLRTVESFKPHSLLTETAAETDDARVSENTGAYVGIEKWAAQPVAPSLALTVSGVRLGLLVLTEKTELQVQLREDWRGLPLGKSMADVHHRPTRIGQRHWTSLRFAEPVDLFTQPFWLLCRATTGDAVWLAKKDDASICMLRHEDEDQSNILEEMTALYEWLIPDNTEVNKEFHLSASLKVDNQIIEPALAEGDTLVYELTGALNSCLQAADSDNGQLTVVLSFSAALPGFITVYSPEVAYFLTA